MFISLFRQMHSKQTDANKATRTLWINLTLNSIELTFLLEVSAAGAFLLFPSTRLRLKTKGKVEKQPTIITGRAKNNTFV